MTTTSAQKTSAAEGKQVLEPIKNRIQRIMASMPPESESSPPTPEEEERTLKKILLAKGVYPVHLNARLSDFPQAPETPPVFISGPVGTGKTHLAVAYLVQEIQKWGGPSRVFIRSVDLFNRLRESFRHNFSTSASEIIENFSRYRFLVIDDLGAERDTPLVQEALYDIIDQRAGHRLPTLITSNFTLNRVAEHYGEFGERLASRIAGLGETLTLIGKDRRWQK
jgi:DNA replication protein DnaC